MKITKQTRKLDASFTWVR